MGRVLPPLNSLRAFEAAARHGSLTRAALELSVTQGAVSRHVQLLEDWMGMELCHRLRRGIELTPEGAAYAAVLATALDQVEAQTRRLRDRPAANILRLKLPPTFAIRWLVPRLAHFHARNRQIDVQITTSHNTVDFDREDIDVAIHWGTAPLPGCTCRRLFGEVLLPVCSPGLFRTHAAPRTPDDLSQHVLLCSLHRPDDWPIWARAAGAQNVDGNSGLKFENSALAYQAAVDQLGIVMAQHAFVEDELRSGRLIAPLAFRAATAGAYYLAYRPSKRLMPLVRLFEPWILEQAAGLENAA